MLGSIDWLTYVDSFFYFKKGHIQRNINPGKMLILMLLFMQFLLISKCIYCKYVKIDELQIVLGYPADNIALFTLVDKCGR